MTLILVSIIVIESVVIAWLYRSRRRRGLDHAAHAGAWLAYTLRQDREIAYWREQANKQRRNTGKAEV